MKLITLYNKRKRAISPVIAVILLIGLAVAASAAIFLVVMPLFEKTNKLELNEAYVSYDGTWTKAVEDGHGYGLGTLVLSNGGTGDVEIVSFNIFYSLLITGPWTEVSGASSIDDISTSNSYIIEPLTTFEPIDIRFPLPDVNDDDDIYYKMVIETKSRSTIDTTKATDIVDEDDMKLAADRPSIGSVTLGTIRRTHTVSPSSVFDNSEVKSVVFEVLPLGGGSAITTKTVTEPLWRWTWNTRNSTSPLGGSEGLPNDDYSMDITVYDYAGLSRSITALADLTIDNDYVDPVISNVDGSSIKNGPDLAEVGESFAISATITDSGSSVSSVSEAYIYYKYNDTSLDYSSIGMDETAGNVWQGNIPADFVDSGALESHLTYFLLAIDEDDNSALSGDKEAGVLDTTKPDITQHTPVTEVDYDSDQPPVISLSVTVEDEDTVDQVNLVWREGNDTGLLIPDPWQVENYISQSGNTWTFSIPTTNVTIDGIDYYINATDPSGNTNDGSASSPYHITINDRNAPSVSFNPSISSPTGPGQDVSVRVVVDDNDPSFSTERYITETGTVRLSYKIGAADWSSTYEMSHDVGDSSKGEDGVWEGVIKGGNFTQLTTVSIRVEALDYAGQINTIQSDVEVSVANEPTFQYISKSVSVWGNSSHIMSFDIYSLFTGDTDANAVITNITTTLSDNTKDFYIGDPELIQIDANGTGIGGTDPRWTNISSPSEGISGYTAVLNNTISIDIGKTTTLTLTYANSSGGFFDLNDMNVTIRFGYTFASGTSSGYSDDPAISEFSTPITVFQTVSPDRYMRSDGQLGTDPSSGFLTLNERNGRWTGSQTVYWYMEVWVRKADTSMTPISTGHAAEVYRTSDGSGLQPGYWTLALNYPLDSTDSVVIRVYMQIGATTYGPVEFVTEQLGAEELVAGQWTVWYYTEREYTSQWNQDRTRGIFYYGDSTYNSRILDFTYTTQTGGAGSMIMSPFSSIGDLPEESDRFTSEISVQTVFLIERKVKRLF
ncbi:hypothetical protein CEE45_05070 [Candidatus Heimdallarchaeota archaeon B3_Heim]|nr:MAG: hypothetical protein CEE45_05070 [Candidatus Heimdallarchaeota archaeon B3_Heim]